MKRKREMFKMVMVVAVVCGFVAIARAVPIIPSGSISFSGKVQLDTDSAGTATEVLNWLGLGPSGEGKPIVQSASGDFGGTVGGEVSLTAPWFFNSGAIDGLWAISSGIIFSLTSSHIVFQGGDPAKVVVEGTGTVFGKDFETTPASWTFTTQDPGSISPSDTLLFSFSAASATLGESVPDGGATAVMLAIGIGGLAYARRQRN